MFNDFHNLNGIAVHLTGMGETFDLRTYVLGESSAHCGWTVSRSLALSYGSLSLNEIWTGQAFKWKPFQKGAF